MTISLPTVSERIASELRARRTAGGWDQAAVAQLLTALGSPTRPATVTRIENGQQAPTVEQLLALALVMGGGVGDLLAPPFTVGGIEVRTRADLDTLLTGRPGTRTDKQAQRAIGGLWDERRHQQIAQTLRTTAKKVADASQRLYGHGADTEISARFHGRLAEVADPPEPETAAWRAYRSHAVRAVTAEIDKELQQ